MDYVITSVELEGFKKLVSATNKKLAKQNFAPITVEYKPEAIQTEEGGYVEGVRCSVTVPDFEYSGKSVLGRIDHEANIVTVNSDSINETVEKYRYITTCDHCGKNRHRNLTFVIDTDEGIKHIGSTCVNAFFGINALSMLNVYNNFKSLAREIEEERIGGKPVFPAELVFQTAFNKINENGYIAKSQDEWNNTAIQIVDAIASATTGYKHDVKLREGIVEYIKGIRNTSNFTNNLIEMIGSDWFNEKQLGYVAYAVKMWMERKDETKQGKKLENGGKYEEVVTVKSKNVYTDPYSLYAMTQNVITMETEDGNTLVWFTTSGVSTPIGESVKIKFIVKKYNEDKQCYYVKNVKEVK